MDVAALPAREDDVADAVADALRDGVKLAIVGGASKAAIGADVEARALPMAGLGGVVDYDPAELVLTVRPGAPLAEVRALLADSGQMLAFEPFDHGPILGQAAGGATIGGIVAAGVSGSQRVSAGAARDHLLGFRAVSGRGEIFAAGAKVVKNVTGYDLPKLAAGSWGRLFAMTELTLKVLPRPREAATRMLAGLDEAQAIRAMARAMGSQAEVAAAAHLPAGVRGGESATILRVQGFGPSVAARCAMLEALLAEFGSVRAPSAEEADAMWESLRTLAPLGTGRSIWRVNVAPSRAGAAVAPLHDADFLFDWAGGLIWVATDADPAVVREAASRAGGHATLVRADARVRARVPAFHPPAAGMAALEQRVRRAFDPAGLFETGRF
ncbi:MAG: FAD-binding protein [Sphingomonas sp.]